MEQDAGPETKVRNQSKTNGGGKIAQGKAGTERQDETTVPEDGGARTVAGSLGEAHE